MTDRELMQQALDALNSCCTQQTKMWFDNLLVYDAISTLRDRLAKPEQEPVAWMSIGVIVKSEIPQFYTGPLYLTPPQRPWVGLTDDDEIPWDGVDAKSFARAIEAKLRSKNT